MKARGRWQGMWTIVAFNWPFYAAALGVLLVAFSGAMAIDILFVRVLCGGVVLGAAYFLVVSLGVSHQVYDRSDLYRWGWLDRALRGGTARRAIFCHSGFDETSVQLQAHLRADEWTVLDHYDEALMTEASIRRARAKYPPTQNTLPAAYDQWPLEPENADAVFGLLAIHELRSEAERVAWFCEAHRCLGAGGRVVLAEHTRDWANFLAFGPGFLHFHSGASWMRCCKLAGFEVVDSFTVTPWVRIFVLQKP